MGEFRYIGTEALIAKGLESASSAINLAAEDFVGKAQADTPVETGTLRASIHVDEEASPSVAGLSARVATGGEADDYAIFVHEGTAAHVIMPAKGKALAFDGHFATIVHHPGTKPYKYLENPLIENRAAYREFMRRAFQAAF